MSDNSIAGNKSASGNLPRNAKSSAGNVASIGAERSVRSRLAYVICALGLGFAGIAAAATDDRLSATIDINKSVILAGHQVAWASAKNDQGRIADDTPMQHLRLILKRSPAQQAAFDQLLKQQQDPTSSHYHAWLTPEQLGETFGTSVNDLQIISRWLQAQGLHVDSIANSHMSITFSGSAAQVNAAFATELHRYQVGTDSRISAVGEPKIPQALIDIVQSVRGLHSSRTHAYHAQKTVEHVVAQASASPKPEASICSAGSCDNYIAPADFSTIYGITPVAQQNITGAGQSIAIVARAQVSNADVEAFENISLLPKNDPVLKVPTTGISPAAPQTTCVDTTTCNKPDDQSEATLDVQRAVSVAPGATIYVVASTDVGGEDGVFVATEYAIENTPVLANILSISFGSCESDAGSSDVTSLDELFSEAAAEGITVLVSSGDAGAAECDSSDTPPSNQFLSPNALCSSGYVTCVGGTQFADTTSPASYWAQQNSSVSNGLASALSYIPEGGWNEPLDSSGATQVAASGGGVSSYIATPSWQVGTGVPGKQGRYTPDIAFSASAHDGYITCYAASNSSCVAGRSGSFTFSAVSGTSAAAPSMAGIVALLNQKIGGAQGNLNPRLYALAATPANGVFHDVTPASSGVSTCQITVPSLCNNSTPGPSALSGGLAGYAVGTGYDEVTGLGSINVANLLQQWTATASVNLNQHGLTGSWFNPLTGGQGIEMEVYQDGYSAGHGLLFGGWFTFDVTAAGGQRWYSLSGDVSNSSASATLAIAATDGGNFDTQPAVAPVQVGAATIQFSDCSHGSLSYSFSDGSGRSGIIPLTRLLTNSQSCSLAGNVSAPVSDYLLSGNWFDPNTSGQGFIFDFSPMQNFMFAAWYTFAPDGAQIGGGASQRWYTLQTDQFVNGSNALNNIPIITSTGGIFDNPATTTPTQVGNANIVFHDCNTMTLAYNFYTTFFGNPGASGSINLQRIVPLSGSCGL